MDTNHFKNYSLLLLLVVSSAFCWAQESIDFIKVNLFSGTIKDQEQFVIKSQDELHAFYKKYKLTEKVTRKIDFDTHMLIVASQGYCGSTGHSVVIKDMYQLDDELIVKVVYHQPGKNCMTGAAVTYPQTVVELKKSDLKIEFKEFAKIDQCD